MIDLVKVNSGNRPGRSRNNAGFIMLITDLHSAYLVGTVVCNSWSTTYRWYDIFKRITNNKSERLIGHIQWAEHRLKFVESFHYVSRYPGVFSNKRANKRLTSNCAIWFSCWSHNILSPVISLFYNSWYKQLYCHGVFNYLYIHIQYKPFASHMICNVNEIFWQLFCELIMYRQWTAWLAASVHKERSTY